MLGTGTQTDPYQIETWDDFIGNDSESYFILMHDLDGNAYQNGVFPLSSPVHKFLNGNGHTIRNLYNMNTGSGSGLFNVPYGFVWENLTIENVQTTAALFRWLSLTANADYIAQLNHCTISADCGRIAENVTAVWTECTVSAVLNDMFGPNSLLPVYANTFTRCSMNVTFRNPSTPWLLMKLNSTRLEADLLNDAAASSAQMSVSNAVLAIRKPTGTGVFCIEGDAAAPSVMDAALWGDSPVSGITDCILLPTSDMQNAEKLNAAGFTVVAVS